MYISESKRCYNVIPSAHYFYIKMKMLADFQIWMSGSLKLRNWISTGGFYQRIYEKLGEISRGAYFIELTLDIFNNSKEFKIWYINIIILERTQAGVWSIQLLTPAYVHSRMIILQLWNIKFTVHRLVYALPEQHFLIKLCTTWMYSCL